MQILYAINSYLFIVNSLLNVLVGRQFLEFTQEMEAVGKPSTSALKAIIQLYLMIVLYCCT